MKHRRLDRKKDKPGLYPPFKAADPAQQLPPSVDLRPGCSPVMDQGDTSSCTANSAAGCMEFLELAELKAKVQAPEEFDPTTFETHSRLFIYYNERRIEGTTQEDSGATIADSVQSLSQYGSCPESLWPFNPHALFNKPNKTAYQEGSSHKISTYMRCNDLGDIKASLAEGFPVLIGITVYDSMMSDDVAATGIVPMPGPDDQVEGGHAVLVVGYDDSKQWVIVRNSWGQGWGDKGYFYLPYAYLQDPDLAEDFWTVRK